MQKTIQDLKKLSNKGQNLFKGFFYYAYIPVVVVLGLRTVSWEQYYNPQMWLDQPSAIQKWSLCIILFIIKLVFSTAFIWLHNELLTNNLKLIIGRALELRLFDTMLGKANNKKTINKVIRSYRKNIRSSRLFWIRQ